MQISAHIINVAHTLCNLHSHATFEVLTAVVQLRIEVFRDVTLSRLGLFDPEGLSERNMLCHVPYSQLQSLRAHSSVPQSTTPMKAQAGRVEL